MTTIDYNGKILILGCGAVSQCLQPLLLRHLTMDFSRITLIDSRDQQPFIQPILKKGARFVQQELTEHNYTTVLPLYLSPGDILIDLTVNVQTADLIDWCQQNQVLFINTSIEWWNPYEQPHCQNLTDLTLYNRHTYIAERAKKWSSNGPTAIVEHGANPGLVSHWTKSALQTIAQHILNNNSVASTRKNDLERALANNDFAQLARHTQTKIIHIAERDTQITNNPKKVNEFVNTWSIDGFYEEGIAPAELGWGTHEQTLPAGSCTHSRGPQNQICLNQTGMDTLMHSWLPLNGHIIGMLIRHGEAYSISRYLTVLEHNKPVYRPTVYYVYLPSDPALCSLHELKMNDYKPQSQRRIMTNDIIDGKDELGVLLLGHDLNGWWLGSELTIQETRDLVGPEQNATTLQVAASMLGALFWMIRNPKKGYCTPEYLPHDEILNIANIYLGTIISTQTNWHPWDNNKNPLLKFNNQTSLDPKDRWQFQTFRASR